MINLIPKEEKRRIIKSFYHRLVIVYLLVLSLCVLIGVVVMMPSYFLTYIKRDLVSKKLEAQKNEPMPLPDQPTLEVIKDLNNKLNLIEHAQNNKFDVSKKIINAIILKKMTDIKITNISYENEPSKGKKISIRGTAPSREILLSFRRALEDDPAFKQVDLPISNFVKGSDIQFYLSLIPL